MPTSQRRQQRQQQQQGPAKLRPQELDVYHLLLRFLVRLQQGSQRSLVTFCQTWQDLHFSHIFEASLPGVSKERYVQLLYTTALDCLLHGIPPTAAEQLVAANATLLPQQPPAAPPAPPQQPPALAPAERGHTPGVQPWPSGPHSPHPPLHDHSLLQALGSPGPSLLATRPDAESHRNLLTGPTTAKQHAQPGSCTAPACPPTQELLLLPPLLQEQVQAEPVGPLLAGAAAPPPPQPAPPLAASPLAVPPLAAQQLGEAGGTPLHPLEGGVQLAAELELQLAADAQLAADLGGLDAVLPSTDLHLSSIPVGAPLLALGLNAGTGFADGGLPGVTSLGGACEAVEVPQHAASAGAAAGGLPGAQSAAQVAPGLVLEGGHEEDHEAWLERFVSHEEEEGAGLAGPKAGQLPAEGAPGAAAGHAEAEAPPAEALPAAAVLPPPHPAATPPAPPALPASHGEQPQVLVQMPDVMALAPHAASTAADAAGAAGGAAPPGERLAGEQEQALQSGLSLALVEDVLQRYCTELQGAVLLALYCLYCAQPGSPTVKIYLSSEHQAALLDALQRLQARGFHDAEAAARHLLSRGAFVVGSTRHLALLPATTPGGGLRREEVAVLREIKFHLASTLRGLGTGGLDAVCKEYEGKLARMWGVLGEAQPPESIADLGLGLLLHEYTEVKHGEVHAVLREGRQWQAQAQAQGLPEGGAQQAQQQQQGTEGATASKRGRRRKGQRGLQAPMAAAAAAAPPLVAAATTAAAQPAGLSGGEAEGEEGEEAELAEEEADVAETQAGMLGPEENEELALGKLPRGAQRVLERQRVRKKEVRRRYEGWRQHMAPGGASAAASAPVALPHLVQEEEEEEEGELDHDMPSLEGLHDWGPASEGPPRAQPSSTARSHLAASRQQRVALPGRASTQGPAPSEATTEATVQGKPRAAVAAGGPARGEVAAPKAKAPRAKAAAAAGAGGTAGRTPGGGRRKAGEAGAAGATGAAEARKPGRSKRKPGAPVAAGTTAKATAAVVGEAAAVPERGAPAKGAKRVRGGGKAAKPATPAAAAAEPAALDVAAQLAAEAAFIQRAAELALAEEEDYDIDEVAPAGRAMAGSSPAAAPAGQPAPYPGPGLPPAKPAPLGRGKRKAAGGLPPPGGRGAASGGEQPPSPASQAGPSTRQRVVPSQAGSLGEVMAPLSAAGPAKGGLLPSLRPPLPGGDWRSAGTQRAAAAQAAGAQAAPRQQQLRQQVELELGGGSGGSAGDEGPDTGGGSLADAWAAKLAELEAAAADAEAALADDAAL